jgi:HlyD family secretion protein
MKKTIIITAAVVIAASVFLIIFVRATSKNNESLNYTEVKKGSFEIAVSGTGELVAANSIDVRGPNLVMNTNFRPSPIRITDIVPEGTIVKKGDYIATLDRSAFSNTLKDEILTLRNLVSEFDLKLLDTAVTLSVLRDDIKNQAYIVEEAGIAVEQSIYEPPAVQRQTQLELQKEERYFDYKQRLYNLKMSQAYTETRSKKLDLDKQRRKVQDLEAILEAFTVRAPANGIVMYKKERNGTKRRAGSMVSPFDMVVATLPELNNLQSRLYVSEIEISKIKTGQEVQLTIDAFKDKSYRGSVSSIANIGEQLANSDSKVFEVLVSLNGADGNLRPSMTTNNRIIINAWKEAVYVPSESVHAGTDSIPFVYTKDGIRQVVILGETNDKDVIVEKGLEAGTSIWLDTPQKISGFKLAGADLIPYIKERERLRRLALENSYSTGDENTDNKAIVPQDHSGSAQ